MNLLIAFVSSIITNASVPADDVYVPLLTKPYSISSCEGRPEGCISVMKQLQNYEKEVADLKLAAEKGAKKAAEGKKATKKQVKPSRPIELNDSDFTEFVKGSDDPSMVLFFAPWCGHCKNMMPDYRKLAGYMQDKSVNIISVDATENSKLAQKFKVQGFPTIVFFPKGGKPQTYRYGRDFESFVQYLEPYTVTKQESEPIEVSQLTSQSQFDENCKENPCLVSILPHLIDGGQSKGRLKTIKALTEAANKEPGSLSKLKLFWMEGGSNLDWEEAVFGSIGYPVTVGIDYSKKTAAVYRKMNTEPSGLADFYKQYATGRVRNDQFRRDLPALKSMAPWNGEDFVMDDEL